MGVPSPLLAGVHWPRRWLFPWGLVGGFPCCVWLWRGVCAWCLCWCVCCVFVVSVLVVVRVWVCLPRVFVCVCVCVCGVLVVCGCRSLLPPAGACCWCWWGCGWCVLWLAPCHSRRTFLCAIPRHSWLGFAAGGGGCSSPLLGEGPGCGSPPLLAGVCWRWWCVVPCHSWLWLLVAATRHSWLGSAGCGWLFRVGRGVLCCVCLWCEWLRVVVLLWCVLCVCGVCVAGGVGWWCGVGVSSACVGVRGSVCVACRWNVVACPRLFRFMLAVGVCVGVVGVCCGSPTNPG